MSQVALFWILVVTLAVGTWSMRSLPIILHGRVPHPAWLERLLKHVPVAALTALVVPGSLYFHVGSTYTLAPARTIAAVAALLAAWRTRNTL
ncbi:MAG: AzlD domain-containing protein, partial [Actinobacteria bacterium]